MKSLRTTATATATTTPENNDLIGWMRKNNRAARAARTLVEIFDVVCQRQGDISKFKVLMPRWTHKSKSSFSIFTSTAPLPVHLHAACSVNKGWKEGTIVTISQMLICKWPFRCRCLRPNAQPPPGKKKNTGLYPSQKNMIRTVYAGKIWGWYTFLNGSVTKFSFG